MAPEPKGPAAESTGKRDARDVARLVGLAVAVILFVAFVVANSSSVRVDFLVFSHSSSLIWVILISALLGVLIDRLVIFLGRRRKARK